MTETTSPSNPYVGPRTFLEEDAGRFFGREREARELLTLVVSERLTLFYAQSGTGKSSLINARLIPRLRDREGFNVLPVGRVSGVLPAGVEPQAVDNIFIYHLMLDLSQKLAENQARPSAGKQHEPSDLIDTSLARFLNGESGPDTATEAGSATAADAESPGPRVLIIDQFEELLTTHPDRWRERAGFFEQLSAAMARHPDLWIVLTMREDYIAGLEPYSHLVPNRLRARFYMQRMGIDAAREAVELPARNAEPKRGFAPEVARMLVDNLRMVRTADGTDYHPGPYVEPVQLQVVCFQLCEDLRPKEAPKVELADLESLAGPEGLAKYVNRALSDFYEQAIANVLETKDIGVTEPVLRKWFSDKLITEAGTRSIVFRNEATGKTEDLSNRAVDLLAAKFLLRTEPRAGGTWVELVHDGFVEPIRQSNQAWFARNQNPLTQDAQAWQDAHEEPAKLYRGSQLAAAAAQLNASRQDFGDLEQRFIGEGQKAEADRTARQLRNIVVGVVLLALLFLALAGWAWLNLGRAQYNFAAAMFAQGQERLARDQADANAATAVAAKASAEAASTRAMAEQATANAASTRSMAASTVAVAGQAAANLASTKAVAGQAAAEVAITSQAKTLQGMAAALQTSLAVQALAVQPPSLTAAATSPTQTGTPTPSAVTPGTPPKPPGTRAPASRGTPLPVPNRLIMAQQTLLAQVRGTQTAIARPQPCSVAPGPTFAQAWDRNRMGCPIAEEFSANTAYEPFEGGWMLWRQDNSRIYAFFDGGEYSVYSFPPWTPVEFSCPDAKDRGNPRLGFGRVWCEMNPDVRQRIGNALGSEIGDNRPLQEFEKGFMVSIRERGAIVNVYDSGQWDTAR
jgi:hypothetical protein